MAASVVGICNSALVKIGGELISTLSDDTKRARLCNEQYEKKRDEVLYSHPWNFALTRTTLSPDVAEPEYEYAYQYSMPSDCLRVYRMEDDSIEFKVEGRKILCDESSLSFLYIAKIVDVTKFTPLFCEALSYALAEDLAFSLRNSVPLAKSMAEMREQVMRRARSLDAQEGTPERITADEWLNARLTP